MRSCAFNNQFKAISGLVLLLLPPLSSVFILFTASLGKSNCGGLCVKPEQRAPRAGAGVVEQLGEGVTDWKEGERVTAVPWPSEHGQGTWQVSAVMQPGLQARLIPKPSELTCEELARRSTSL